jgi:polyphosphate kinase
MTDARQDRAVELYIHGRTLVFDVDDPVLPDWVAQSTLTSGGYPYKKKVNGEEYLKELETLQIELVKVQSWLQSTGKRIMALFEGRDAAGKGGAIAACSAHMNPRLARVVALSKPTERELGQ